MSRRTACRARVLIPLLLLFAAGCGSGRYSVSGRVTYEDGTPVPAGTVIGEAAVDGKPVSVQGNIEADGSFSWGTERPGDGAPPGNYKVVVMPRALSDAELGEGKRPDVDGKYTKYETSGLSFEVKPQRNEFNITVSRPKPKAGGN
jgi:hypothetical protein